MDLSLPFNHPGCSSRDHGRLAVGRTAPHSREDTDPEQNVAKDRGSEHPAGGREGKPGREGNPLAADVSVAGAAAGRGLCGPAAVPMMEAADHGRLDDPALIGTLHRSGLRGVLVEGEVCSGAVVVDEVVAQQATQVGLVQDDDVIEALAAQGADEAFDIGILPRGPRRRSSPRGSPGIGLGARTRPRRSHRGRAAGIGARCPTGTPPRAAGPSTGRWGRR